VRSGAAYTNATVNLTADGWLYIDGVKQKVQIDKETTEKLKDIEWSKVKLQNSGNHCYPILGKTAIHTIVINDLKEAHFNDWKYLGWDGVLGNLVVGHLDNNTLTARI
jgi:hypothetical protein